MENFGISFTSTNVIILFLVPLYIQYIDSKIHYLGSDGWANFSQLFTQLKNLFDLKGPLEHHKFVISNKNIDFSWTKKDFVDFIERHKCSVNNPVRIFSLKKGTIFQLSADHKQTKLT